MEVYTVEINASKIISLNKELGYKITPDTHMSVKSVNSNWLKL